MSFVKSGILLQQPIAPLEGVSAHFSFLFFFKLYLARVAHVFHHPQGNERTGSSWADVRTFAGPILLRLGRETKNGGIFEISLGHRKSRIYPNQNIFFSQKYFK